MAEKSKWRPNPICFRIFALKGTIFARFQNPFLHSNVFLVSEFCGSILGNQNGGLAQDGVIFGKKLAIIEWVLPP
jgi:hypothetical protein